MKSWDLRGRESHVTGAGFAGRAARMGELSSSARESKSSKAAVEVEVEVVKEDGWGRERGEVWRCSEGLGWEDLAREALRLCECDDSGLDIWGIEEERKKGEESRGKERK